MNEAFKVYLSRILSENQVVLLQGIGVLKLSHIGAAIDEYAGTISPPRDQIYFEPSEVVHLDPVLVRIVQIIHGLSREESMRRTEAFMGSLRMELDRNLRLMLPKIGSITRSPHGDTFFTPDATSQEYNTSFGLPRLKLPAKVAAEQQEVTMAQIPQPAVPAASMAPTSSSQAQPTR
ncbi:MAG: hypothetical protein KTR24_13680, partial [Saprospiraceae bacterium]|nr:hypothetical protein [Saprospiraceae bacterium]